MSQLRRNRFAYPNSKLGAKSFRSRIAAVAAGLTLVGSSIVGLAAPVTAAPIPGLTLTPDINIGSVFAGTRTDYTLELKNTGPDPKDLTGITIEGSAGVNMTVTSHDCQGILQPGELCEIQATHHPSGVGDGLMASVGVKLDGDWLYTYFKGETLNPLTAQGSIDLDFGEVLSGDVKELPIFLENTSGVTVTVGTVSGGAGGGTNDPFLRVADCAGQVLAPNDVCTLTYTFTPFKVGDFEENAGTGTNFSILGGRYGPTLTGTGVLAWQLSPTTLDFESVPIGGSRTLDIVATNQSGAGRTVTAFNLGLSGLFTTTSTCEPGTQVAAGEACIISVTFSPVHTNYVDESRTFTFGGGRYPISVTGLGFSEPDYDMWVMSPVDLDFGDVVVGDSASLEMVLTFSGEGTGTFFPKDIDFGPDFEVTSDCEAYTAYDVDEFCTFTVTFTPSDVDEYDESDTVNFWGSEFALTATGTGIAAVDDTDPTDWDISPMTLYFLLPEVGQSETDDFVVTNQSGSERTVPVFDLDFGPKFLIDNNCTPGLQLADGQTCTISVTYTATSTDFVERKVDLALGDWVFPLTVMGLALEEPDYDMWNMSPLDLDFGDVLIGESKDLTTTLTFIEGYGLFYPKVIDFGPGFSVVTDCEDFAELEVDEFCTFTVTFTPTSAQAYAGTSDVNFYGSEFALTATGTGITKPAVPQIPSPVADNPKPESTGGFGF